MVENGGGYSDEIMLVKIRVNIPEGHFAMGFFYDEKSGTLEGMPLVEEDKNSITIATMHFSWFVVSSIDKKLLLYEITGRANSGFRPGVDDWQFPNKGSFIAPGGHCAGQSLTAMWYYAERTLNGFPHLYNLYDNNGNQRKTPSLWHDDTLGYRLASTVQNDMNWANFVLKLESYVHRISDELTYCAFAHAILQTGQPQYVGIYSTSTGGGHAMVIYRVSNGTLYVADPNYPGKSDREIELVNGRFIPYNSGANKEAIELGQGVSFDRIRYLSKTAYIDWSKLTSRWREFEKGTIGFEKMPIGKEFPPYALEAVQDDGTAPELRDGFTTDKAMLSIRVISPTPYQFGTNIYRDDAWLRVDAKGNPEGANVNRIQLKPGNNLLGIWVCYQVTGISIQPYWTWVDFKWVNVIYERPTPTTTPTTAPMPITALSAKPDLTVTSVSISPTSGKAGDEITVNFTVKNQGGSPAGSFSYRVSLATTRWGTDYLLDNKVVPTDFSLKAGGESKRTAICGPISEKVPAGSYWVTVFVDRSDEIDESDEDNNIGSSHPAKFTVTAPPTTPPASGGGLTGTWKGTLTRKIGGFGDETSSMTWTLAQSGTSVTGTYVKTITGTEGLSPDPVGTTSRGKLNGTVRGTNLTIQTEGGTVYSGTFTATTISGSVGGTFPGTFSLRRQ